MQHASNEHVLECVLHTSPRMQADENVFDCLSHKCINDLQSTLVVKPHTMTYLAGGYNPDDFEDLPVSEEVQDVFKYILQYKPEVLQLETPLKPFIPDYVPAVGDIDEFIKVGRSSMCCISSCTAVCITFIVRTVSVCMCSDSVTQKQCGLWESADMPTCPVLITVSCFTPQSICKPDTAAALHDHSCERPVCLTQVNMQPRP